MLNRLAARMPNAALHQPHSDPLVIFLVHENSLLSLKSLKAV